MPEEFLIPQEKNDFLIKQTQCILRSYRYWLGNDLPQIEEATVEIQAQAVFHAPYVLASSEAGSDPRLNYGNAMALKLWELPWDQFTSIRGTETAEEVERSEREKFLKTVKENGYVDNYEGIRISSTGKRFRIKKAVVWNLIDEHGNYCGQAAMFDQWEYLT